MPSRLSTPEEALQRLIEGNKRFVRGEPIHGRVSEEAFAILRENQRPFAVIVGRASAR
jgi:carbonic anhydrase